MFSVILALHARKEGLFHASMMLSVICMFKAVLSAVAMGASLTDARSIGRSVPVVGRCSLHVLKKGSGDGQANQCEDLELLPH